jgi:hypothetical protein
MAVEITPQPSDEEREAILQALALDDAETAPPAPWRLAALGPREDDERLQAAALLRQTRGATRA